MSEAISTGSCLCGAVRIQVAGRSNKVGACHCDMCRKWASGPYMEITCDSGVSFEGEENISIFESSDWAERGFCRECGSHLFYRLKSTGQHMVAVGLFDDQDDLIFDNQVFTDRNPGFYGFSNNTRELTEAQIFEKHEPA